MAIQAVTKDFHYEVMSNDRRTCRVQYTHDTDTSLPPVVNKFNLYKNDGTEKTAVELKAEMEEFWPYGYWTYSQKPNPVDVLPLIGVSYDVDPVTTILEEEAPNDGRWYGRQDVTRSNSNGNISNDSSSVTAIPDAPADGELYGRRSLSWQAFNPFVDASSDGKQYARKDGDWSEVKTPYAFADYMTFTENKAFKLYEQTNDSISDSVTIRVRWSSGDSRGLGEQTMTITKVAGSNVIMRTSVVDGALTSMDFKVTDNTIYALAYGTSSPISIEYCTLQAESVGDATRVLFDTTLYDDFVGLPGTFSGNSSLGATIGLDYSDSRPSASFSTVSGDSVIGGRFGLQSTSTSLSNGSGAYGTNQGDYATALGHQSANENQGEYSLALGFRAGWKNQGSNGIILNSSTYSKNSTSDNHFHIQTPSLSIDYTDSSGKVNFNKPLTVNGSPVILSPPNDGKFYALQDGQWIDITARLN